MVDKAEVENILSETTKLGQDNHLYHWSGIIEEDTLDIEKIYVRNVGTVDIPVTPEVVDSIEKKYLEVSAKEFFHISTKELCPNCCRVDGSEVFVIPGNKKKLSDMLSSLASSVLGRMLDVNVQNLLLGIKVNLDQLVICKFGQTYSRSLTNKKESGMFGTMLMQIPIASNQQNGQLSIRDVTRETKVQLDSTTQNRGIFVAGIAGANNDDGSQEITIYPSQPNGIVFVLVFNLVWRDYLSMTLKWTSCYVIKYLMIANKLSKSLCTWNKSSSEIQLNVTREATSAFDAKASSFFCVPLVMKTYGCDPSTWKLTGPDLIMSTIFGMLDFVDVNFGIIKRKTLPQTISNEASDKRKPAVPTTSLFVFEKGFFSPSPNTIRDGLFNTVINGKKQLIHADSSSILSSTCLPVIVVRSRKASFRIPKRPSMEEIQPEALIIDLEERLLYFTEDSSDNHGSLLRNLELLLDLLQDEAEVSEEHIETKQLVDGTRFKSSPVKCMKCLLYRLLVVCVKLKNANHGLRVLLHLSNLNDQAIFFRCHTCGVDLSNPKPISVIANFICLVAGWDLSYIPMKIMLGRKLDINTYSDLCELGIQLVHGDCKSGAREIFYHVFCYLENDALQRFQTEELCYGTQFFSLAMEIHAKNNDDTLIQRAFRLSKMTSPSSLLLLIKYLVELKQSGKMDTAFYLRGLGDLIAEKLNSTFFVDHLMKILKTFHEFGEKETVELLWTNICAQCVQIYNSEDYETANLKPSCVFCHLLLSTDESNDDLLKTMASARNAQDALACSIDKITVLNSGSPFHYKEILSFVRRIICLQNVLPVYFHSDRKESFCLLFSCIHPEDLFGLIDAILGPKRDQVTRNGSVKCQLIERLIHQLPNRKEELFSKFPKDHIRKALEFCAWKGDVEWMRQLLKKIDERIAAQPDLIETLVSTIASTVKAKIVDQDAALHRDVIHLLLFKWAKSLRSLKSGQMESFVDCFLNLFRAEQTCHFFPNPGVLTMEFSRTIDRFELIETVEIVKGIFTSEYGEEIDSSLKILATSLKIFSSLCNSINSRITGENILLISVDSLVVLMQCFFWLGEEKPIVDLTLLLLSLPRSLFVEETLDAIIYEENSADLAAGTSFGVVALGDLIDRRIDHLTTAPASRNFFKRICPPRLTRKKSPNSITVFHVASEQVDNLSQGTRSINEKMQRLSQTKAKFLKG